MILRIPNILKLLFINHAHKPVHKVTFFFIASLVMLVPFASINIFSNAMAVEEMNPYMNNEDYSQRYERFYQDDSFRESYYDYHKQHHQQQTSYNNDYSYDSDYEPEYSFYKPNYEQEYNSYENDSNNKDKSKDSEVSSIKKIKCNNINSNLNGVESSPDLNNLLGVGGDESIQDEDASANAYGYNGYKNNGNFDIDCINNNDNEGGQGITGPQGPQGPAGPNQILSSNLYSVEGEEVTATPESGQQSSIAECNTGDTVLEGGYQITISTINPPPLISKNGPLPNPINLPPYTGPDNSAYAVAMDNVAVGTTTTFSAYAYCFDNSP